MPASPTIRPALPALLVLLVLLLAACGAEGGSDEASPEAAAAASVDTSPVTVVDGTGTEVTLDAPARRVVCLDGTCVDALAELGQLPVAAQTPDMVVHPAFFGDAGSDVAHISGTFFEPSLEDIAAAEPDLVMGSAGVHGELREALAGIAPLYGQRISDPEAAVDNLRQVAVLVGRTAEGEAAAERFDARLSAYEPGERSEVVLSAYGGATADMGIDAADSLIGQLLSRYTAYPWPSAGEGTSGFLEFSLEGILDVDPDAIFVLDFAFDPNAAPLVEQLAEERLWAELTAVQRGQVHTVDNTWWGRAWGTRALPMYLDEVMTKVFPDEFPEAVDVG